MIISTQFSRVGYVPFGSHAPVSGHADEYSRRALTRDAARDAFRRVGYLGGGIAFLAWHGARGRALDSRSPQSRAFAVGYALLAPAAALAAVAVGLGTFLNPVDAQYQQARDAVQYGDVSCWDDRTRWRYSNDSPAVIRMKFAAIMLGAPLYLSVITAVNVGLFVHYAVRAASHGRLARTAQLSAYAGLAPLGGFALAGLACVGLLLPLEARCVYATLERRTRAWPSAPCFQPMDVPRPLWSPFHRIVGLHDHGLGGMPLDAAGTVHI